MATIVAVPTKNRIVFGDDDDFDTPAVTITSGHSSDKSPKKQYKQKHLDQSHSQTKQQQQQQHQQQKQQPWKDSSSNEKRFTGPPRPGGRYRARAEELLPQRKQLPIYSARDTIVSTCKSEDTVVIISETGSGKTTQIPQYLYESGIIGRWNRKGAVAITQPRRVAATSIAKRVSEELGCPLGSVVGYTVRFDDMSNPAQTDLKFVTDGMLLREILSDKLLTKYSCIVLDEAHERTLRTDILFGMLKDIQRKRANPLTIEDAKSSQAAQLAGPLKLIIMSATLDAERFSEYFGGAKILYIAGRQFPVKVYNTFKEQADYVDAALVTTFQIHLEQPMGDILVFLSGQDEIENLEKLIKDQNAQIEAVMNPSGHVAAGHGTSVDENEDNANTAVAVNVTNDLPEDATGDTHPYLRKLLVCPIFAALPPAQQAKVFQPAPDRFTRKVILATNIAETSITIPGVRYVVDTGVHKMRDYKARAGIESLLVEPISKSSARQRTGRAGREAPGICYRLYTEDGFDSLIEDTIPEIKRCNLAMATLQLLAAGVTNIQAFDFMDPPSRTSLMRALEQLLSLGALSDSGRINELGLWMSEFPLEPPLAKVIYTSRELKCTAEVIDIISLLSVDTLFFSPPDKRDQSADIRRQFVSRDGDHLTFRNMLLAYLAANGDPQWCRDHFVNGRGMRHVMDVRKQLRQHCTRLGFDIDALTCGSNYDVVLQCFLSGYFGNTALLQPDGSYRTLIGSHTVAIHPSSVMHGRKVEAIMYDQVVFTSKLYVRGVSAVQASWIPKASPKYLSNLTNK